MSPTYSVVIPTFNEALNIESLIRRIQQVLSAGFPDHEIFVVDDHSPDGTGDLVIAMQDTIPQVHLLPADARSRAAAIHQGLMAASGHYRVVMDADGQHDPNALPDFFEKLSQGYDIVVGTRWPTYEDVQQPILRRLISRAGRLAGRWAGMPLSDPTSGFFGIRREIAERILPQIRAEGFRIFQDIWIAADTKNIAEIAYHYGRRHHGVSKMPLGHLLDMSITLAKIRLRARRRQQPAL